MRSGVDARTTGRFPFTWVFLGFGFWWAAWFSEKFKGSSWLSLGQHGPLITQAGFLIGSLPYAFTFLALVLLRKRIEPIRQRRVLLAVAAVVAGLGLAFVSLGGSLAVGLLGSVVGLITSQAAIAFLFLAWIDLCATVGTRLTCIGVGGSTVVGVALHAFMVIAAPAAPLATVIVLACCPALSAFCLAMAWRRVGVTALEAPGPAAELRLPRDIMIGMAVYGFAIGFMVSLTTLQPSPGASVGLVPAFWNGGASLAILLAAVLLRKFDVRLLYWPILITLAVGFMLLPVAGYGYANDVAHAGIACVTVFWIATCADLVERTKAPVLFVVGWGAFANAGGLALGGLACAVLLNATALNAWHLSVIAMAVVFLQMLASVPLLGGTTLSVLWDMVHPPSPELPEGLVEARCSEIAAKHGLTPREGEILVQLAQGRTADEIGRALVISDATVRTHVKRIHEKLQVHSQPQLIRMVVFTPQV
jgi:DNA-binding CsgD family transcriptional regulator